MSSYEHVYSPKKDRENYIQQMLKVKKYAHIYIKSNQINIRNKIKTCWFSSLSCRVCLDLGFVFLLIEAIAFVL